MVKLHSQLQPVFGSKERLTQPLGLFWILQSLKGSKQDLVRKNDADVLGVGFRCGLSGIS